MMYNLIKNGYEILPKTYIHFASKSKIAEKRKTEIEDKRGRLKIVEDDSKIVKIIIEELLAYKPNILTIDDRYLQLEQLLDALDKAKAIKEDFNLVELCKKITHEIRKAPGKFKNSFLDCLQTIEFRIKAENINNIRAKL